MRFLSQDESRLLEPNSAREKAYQFSNLCYSQQTLIKKQQEQIENLMNELDSKNQQVLLTKDALEQIQNHNFGRRSEKRPGDAPLLNQVSEKEPVKAHERKKRTKFGRKDQVSLPVVEVIHEMDPEEAKEQGLEKWPGQFESSELINIKPMEIVLEHHKRQKYRAKGPDSFIVTAQGPLKLKEGSRYSVEFAVEVGLNKYNWHLPLDRQCRMYKDYGLDVGSHTLYEQVDTIAWYFKETLFSAILQEVRSSPVTLSDDTLWKNLEKLSNRKKANFYLWAVMNDRAVGFNVFDSRSQAVAKDFLGDLKGVLVTDGHSSFKALGNKNLILANDWYHARRKFVQAEKSFPKEAQFFIGEIAKLAKIEEKIKGFSSSDRLQVREQESKPIVDSIQDKMIELSSVLPESSLGKAITYTQKLWTGLNVFLTHPDVPLDTNAVERILRNPVTGRKNHYGSKTLVTAETAAIWYTVIETCKLSGKNPRDYITYAIKTILKGERVLLPWEWENTS